MKPNDNNIEDILTRHLPSASQEEAETDCDNVLQHLRAGTRREEARLPSAKRTMRWLAFAAVAAVIVFVVSLRVIMLRETPAVLEIAARNVQFGEVVNSSIFGEVAVLADGSRVEMHTNSELVLERADDGVRIHLSKGGVIVNAAKQPKGHLYVQTKDVIVSVVGTVFLVNAEAEGSRVAVLEGEVRVQHGSIAQKLRPGEQMASNPKMQPLGLAEAVAWSRLAGTHLAQLQQTAVAPKPVEPRVAFEEASIRPGGAGVRAVGRGGGRANVNVQGCSAGSAPQVDPRRFAVSLKNLYTVITMAYFGGGFQACRYVSPLELLSGGPDWVRSEAFDIQATIPEGSFNSTPALNDPKLQKMLQTLLEERFKLTLRREMKEMPVYIMTLKDPSRFVPHKEGPLWVTKKPQYWNEGSEERQDVVAAEGPWVYGLNATMTQLVPLLGRLTGRPILDRTGFTGKFIFSVVYETEFTRPNDGNRIGPGDIAVPGDPRPPNEIKSLISVLEKEAGIKLELSKEKVEVLVIDHVEKPSEN